MITLPRRFGTRFTISAIIVPPQFVRVFYCRLTVVGRVIAPLLRPSRSMIERPRHTGHDMVERGPDQPDEGDRAIAGRAPI
jgi:hypothetical protein